MLSLGGAALALPVARKIALAASARAVEPALLLPATSRSTASGSTCSPDGAAALGAARRACLGLRAAFFAVRLRGVFGFFIASSPFR